VSLKPGVLEVCEMLAAAGFLLSMVCGRCDDVLKM
jgi:hypothetical protein